MYDILQLNDMLLPELNDLADKLEINDADKKNKEDLIYKILDKQAVSPEKPKATAKASTTTATATVTAKANGLA